MRNQPANFDSHASLTYNLFWRLLYSWYRLSVSFAGTNKTLTIYCCIK